MAHLRRKGSLAWYENSKRGLSTLVPRTKNQGIYGVKVGMVSQMVQEILTPITLIHLMPMARKDERQFLIDLRQVKTIKKPVARTIYTTKDAEALHNQIVGSPYVDVIGLTKGKGTLGPIQRRNIKMQKRKAAKSGVTRKPGAMGLRVPGKVVWTKPFSGKTGFSRRTILSLKNCGTQTVENYTSLRYFTKKGTFLKVKGGVPGPIGRVLLIRKAQRK